MKLKKLIYGFLLILLIAISSCKAKTPLEAIERGRLQDLKEFHQKGYKLNEKVNKKDNFLIYSIKKGYDDIAIWLINNKINDINEPDCMENTPIMLSYTNKRVDVFNTLLLKKKIKLNYSNFNGKNLISLVVENGDYKNFIRLIKKHKINIKFKVKDGLYENYTIIQFAVSGGNLEIVKYLKDKMPRFWRKHKKNPNLMIIAAEKGNIEMMTFLDSAGIKMDSENKDGWTTLMSAAKSGKLDAVMLILGYGANVNARTTFNWTALMSAVMSKNIEIVKVLVEAGAKITAENNDGKNSFEIAIDENNTEIANYLKDKIEKTK